MPIRFAHKPGLVVYLTAGDAGLRGSQFSASASLNSTREIAIAAIDAGADVIELGVPFSDPLADGPIIQRASERALAHGTRLKDVLSLAREIRAARPKAGLVIFSYLNPILRYGLHKFADDAAAAGVDGVLPTDLIVEEAAEFLAEMSRVNLAPIFLAAPTSPDARLQAIASHSRGFVYAISRVGITGTQQTLASDARSLVERLRRYTTFAYRARLRRLERRSRRRPGRVRRCGCYRQRHRRHCREERTQGGGRSSRAIY